MGNLFKKTTAALAVAAAAFAVDVPMTITAKAAGGCEGHSGYTELKANTLVGNNTLGGGSFYLEEALTLKREIEITSGSVTICLNGKTITAADGERVFNVKQGASLTICDCGTNGRITGGTAEKGGGVFVENGGTFALKGGTIYENNAEKSADPELSYGGGVYVDSGGTFTMSGGTISKNAAKHQGGGVFVHEGGSFTMSGGAISGNRVTARNDTTYGGAGVYTAGVFTMNGSGKISGNTSEHFGAGVCVSGRKAEFILEKGEISGNNADTYGGGVHVSSSGTVNMRGGTISGNTTADGRGGGGVSVSGGSFTMENGSISGNTSSYGGGLYLTGGKFTMTGGAISGNNASLGSCVYMDIDLVNGNPGGTLLLDGRVTITSNTNSNVYLKDGKTITIGSNFSATDKIGVHPERRQQDCQHNVPAAVFDTGVNPTDISNQFKADIQPESVAYDSTAKEIKVKGPHSYDAANWEITASEHWHICTVCGDEAGKAAHRWDNGTIIRQPTPEEEGEIKYVCLDCAYPKTEPLPYKAPSATGGNRTHDDEDNSVASTPSNPPTGISLAIAPAALAAVWLAAAITRKRR